MKNRETKRRLLLTVVLVAVIVFAAVFWREHALRQAQRDFSELLQSNAGKYNDNVIVLSDTSHSEAKEMAEIFGGSLRITENGRFATITLPEGMTLKGIAENDSYRKYYDRIQLDYNNSKFSGDVVESYASFQVTDSMYSRQTYLDYLNIGDTWNVTTGKRPNGEKTTVAIIDSGIDTDHPEFFDTEGNSIISHQSYNASEDKVVEMYDISVIEDSDGHGTAVAGVIAAQMNGSGVVGIAPDVELLIIKVQSSDEGNIFSTSDLVFGIYYAIEKDVDVINMSFTVLENVMKNAVQLAVDSDIICIAAAGDSASQKPAFPAADENVIGVGALEENSWVISGTSNFGINSDLMAPGWVFTTGTEGKYCYGQGTSFSAPIVSAAVALYRAQNEYVTYTDLKAALLAAGRDLDIPGEDTLYGFGALDIHAFVCEEKGRITYDYCTEEIAPTTQVFVRQHTIQTVPEPEREKIIFDDWYYDKAYTRVFDYDAWYSTEFVEDITLYAKWVNEDDEDASVYNYKTLSDGTVEIVSYKGKRRYLIVPETIDGKTVSSIGASAFAGNGRIREVSLPEGLVYIKSGAFFEVNRMRAVNFRGTQLLEISEKAFANCTSLRELNLPDSVQIIGEKAFLGCSAMTAVNISEKSSLTSMGRHAFSEISATWFYIPENVTDDGFDGSVLAYSSAMRKISVHPENTAFVVADNTMYSADKGSIVYYPAALTGTYSVATDVDYIGDYAFAGSVVSEISLNAVESIGEAAFAGTKKLKTVTMPDTVTTMGMSAFESSSISSVVLSENLTEISIFAFSSSKLTSIHIPAGIQLIGMEAFFNCTYLKKLTFAENSELNIISSGAFSGCGALGNFTFPESLEEIGGGAFERCSAIDELYIPKKVNVIGLEAFSYCTSLNIVEFAEACELEVLPDSCFYACSELETVYFSDNIKTLGTYAFGCCDDLSALNFGEASALTAVGSACFEFCDSLKLMQLPAGVKTIGQFAYVSSGLELVSIESEVIAIGKGAFAGCYELTKIYVAEENNFYRSLDNVLFDKDITKVYCVPSSRTGCYSLPETVTVTMPYSFYYDSHLSAIILPEGLEDIQENTFYYCADLTAIEIPTNVVNIGREAFGNCYDLETVMFAEGSKLQRLGIYTFVNCAFQEITIPAAVKEMAQYVFYGCNELKKITFEENSALTYLAAYFLKGTKVEYVVFEEGSALTSLQAHAFDGASKLKSVDFGTAQITNVDNYAFYNCAMLEGIDLPDTVTYIGRYAFYGCSMLERITISAAIDFIGQSAFYGTNKIKLFFVGSELPANLDEDWDKGISGYYLDCAEHVVTDEWEYTITGSNTLALARYLGSATELAIDTIDGLTVEKIGAGCFADNDTLISVTLSKNITEIGNYAFENCDGLKSLTVPASVEKIGKYAFADSSTVVSIKTGSALTSIGSYAFSGNATKTITLPDSVTKIGEGAFSNSALATISIGESSKLETIGREAFVGSGITAIYLPATLESVGVEAFKNVTTLTEIEVAGGDTALKLSNSAFEGSGIEEITIPARVYYIGEYTFGSCPELQNIHVASGNEAYTSVDGVLFDCNSTTLIQYPIGRSGAYEVPAQTQVLTYSSFRDAKKLTEVTFAEGSAVKTIGWQTFSGCDKLTKITVPDAVVSFDFYAFENCTALEEVVLSETSGLTGVYEGAFYGCTALRTISLPDAVTEIGDYAFYNCAALTKIPLAETSQVKGIYDYAFSGCTSITEIPEFTQLVEIGERTFADTDISEYYVPATVKKIAANAFAGCKKFTAISCAAENEAFVSINGALYEKGASAEDYDALVIWPYGNIWVLGNGKTKLTQEDTEILSLLPGLNFSIADTITQIGEYAFHRIDWMEQIEIPESVRSIAAGAFSNCNDLREVILPEGVTSIGEDAFFNCARLEHVVIPESLTDVGGSLFRRCPKLKSVGPVGGDYNIELDWKKTIPGYVFSECESLTQVVVPEGIIRIGERAFWRCINLTSVTMPESVTEMSLVFDGCTGIKTAGPIGGGYNYEFAWTESIPANAFYACKGLTEVVIPDTVTCVGKYAFYYCEKLASVLIPQKVTVIERYAFYRCTDLSSITIMGSDTQIEINAFGESSNVKTAGPIGGGFDYEFAWKDQIPENALAGLSGLQNVVFPEGLTRVGERAFADCTSLDNVVIPNGVTCIGSGAFEWCTGLTSIVIPESVTEIGGLRGVYNYAFTHCVGLKTAGPIGSGCDYEFGWTESIPANAFMGCDEMTKITIPGSITSIGTSFSSFPYIKTAGPIGGGYDYEFGWQDSIPAGAFHNCTGLISVELPESVTAIGNGAFNGCSSLTAVVIPEAVTIIEGSAFSGCSSLASIEIPDAVTTIGTGAFNGCSSLTSIVIPESAVNIGNTFYGIFSGCVGLETAGPMDGEYNVRFGWTDGIPDSVFRDCSGLKSIEIPAGMKHIGERAFQNCSALMSITFLGDAPDISSNAFLNVTATAYYSCYSDSWTEGMRQHYGGTLTWESFDPCVNGHVEEIIPAVTQSFACTDGMSDGVRCSVCRTVLVAQERIPAVTDHDFDNGVCSICKSVPVAYGSCGSDANWTLLTDGTIYLYGTGAMRNFGYQAAVPWYPYGSSIKKVVIYSGLTSISRYAFSSYGNLVSISIPDTVTQISSEAFSDCKRLQTISVHEDNSQYYTVDNVLYVQNNNELHTCPGGYTGVLAIPGEVSSIAAFALKGCLNLTGVELPDSMSGIGQSAFSGCISLTHISIPGSVAAISDRTFEGCTALHTVTLSEGVTQLGKFAFYGCRNIQKLTIPESLTNIGSFAFRNCVGVTTAGPVGGGYAIEFGWIDEIPNGAFSGFTSLTKVILPEGIRSIGDNAFSGCSVLTNIAVPESVTAIGDYAFYGCNGLISVTIPQNVMHIGDEAFAGCEGLTCIMVEEGNTAYKSVDGVLYEQSCDKLLLCPPASTGSLIIPEGVISISDSAFGYCRELTSIVIPNTVINIGNSAFRDCSSLTEITIPMSVTSIGNSAFYNCSSLTNITIPDSVTSIEVGTFQYCSNLTSVTLPASMTAMGDGVFSDCTNLRSITIPEGVTTIGQQAFYNCKNLASITIPESVTTIGNSAFDLCSNLKSVILPEKLSRIVSYAFRRTGLTTIVFQGDPPTIDPGVFEGVTATAYYSCRKSSWTTEIMQNYGGSLTWVSYDPCETGHRYESVVTMPTCAVQGYTTHTCTRCGESYTDSYVESSGHSYESVVTAPTCTENGYTTHTCTRCGESYTDSYVESSGHSYESVVTAPTCTENGYTTYTCTVCGNCCIDSYVDSSGHTVIVDAAVEPGCMNGLTEGSHCSVCGAILVTQEVIPAITSHSFADGVCKLCGSECIAYGACGVNVNWGLHPDGTLYIYGSGAMSDYTSEGVPWYSDSFSIQSVVIYDGVTSIGDYAFAKCSNLEQVTIPDGVVSIGDYTFSNCTNLTKITIPESVTILGSGVFYNCASLKNVTIPSSITSISDSAFSGCNSLTDFVIPDSVTSIGIYAFYKCNNLSEIIIPNSISEIKRQAFSSCKKLKTVMFYGDAPSIGSNAFYGIIATAYYSCYRDTWKSDIMHHYGGTLTWRLFDPVDYGHKHNYNTVITAPKCVEQGYTTHMCDGCGNKFIDTYVKALGHKEVIDVAVKASCTENGLTEGVHCSVCNEVLKEQEVISAVGHVEGKSVTENEVAATCTTDGSYDTVVYCDVCDAELSRDTTFISAGGHSYGNWFAVTAATCTEDGQERRDCANCDQHETRVVSASGHSVKNGICEVCETVFVQIVTQPVDVEVPDGEAAKVTIEAEGEGLTYAWYYRNRDQIKFRLASSFTSNTYYVTMGGAGRDGRQVYCIITDKYGNIVQSDTVTLSMGTTPLVIVTQPKAVAVANGELAEVFVEVTGDGLTYEWYFMNANGTKFSKTAAFTGSTYSVTMSSARDGRQIYCVITDAYGNSVTTETVTLSMATTPLMIVTQPENVTVAEGESAEVTVKATGDGLTYEWYFKNAGGSKFSKTSTFTGPTYSVSMSASRDGRQVYCVITDAYGTSVTTEIATLSMEAALDLEIITQPMDVTVAEGETAEVTVEAVGEELTYAWYYMNAGGTKFSKTTAFTGPTYSVTMSAARDGRQVYCVITDKYGASVTTDTVTLSMEQAEITELEIITQPESVTVAAGETAEILVEAAGDGLTYEWYYKNPGSSKFTKTSTFAGPEYSLTMNGSRSGRHVYCKITDAYGKSVTTDIVTLNMASDLELLSQPEDITVATSETAVITVDAVGEGLSYAWYYRNAGAESFSLTTTFTGDTYSLKMTESRSGRQIYCVITDALGNTVSTDVVTLRTAQ